jgi:hypothetical protein
MTLAERLRKEGEIKGKIEGLTDAIKTAKQVSEILLLTERRE